ncbi:tyrosine recombinase XerC [Corynebacterium marquesiae]|uniref:site-specific integrase n=1 Tax=Corynebacterium marquesiae TaxID=2913503 RepID=UPI0038CF7EC8
MKPVKDLKLGSIYQTKNGRWRAAITVGWDGQGRQVRRTVSAKTEAECIRRRNELYLQLKKGESSPQKITVETFTKKWLDSTAFEMYAPQTLRGVKGQCRKYIIPTLGKYALKDVGADEVRELISAVRNAGCGDRYTQQNYSTFSVIMRDAVRRGLIERNPCSMVDRPRAVRNTRTALTADQARHLIIHSAKAGDTLASMWASYLLLGARNGELLGLTRSRVSLVPGMAQIDLSWAATRLPWRHGRKCKCAAGAEARRCNDREAAVPPAFEWYEIRGALAWTRPKTEKSRRIIPVPAPLDEVLRRHIAETPQNEWDLMWLSSSGLPLRHKRVLIRWRAALKDAGLPIVDLHTARHTAATLLRECGVGPEVIASILGHSKIDTTFGYVHVNATQAQRAMDAYSSLLSLPGGYGEAPDKG